MTDIARTLGALLIGGSIALVLSGIVAVQCIIYFKLYTDEARCRLVVAAVWILDVLHSVFIVVALFNYLIDFFGDRARIDHIHWSIALSVVVTAGQTLLFHWYFAHKIYQSSGKNWWITAPIVILAFLRLFAASVSTTEMIRLHRYSAFNETYPGWIFTTGLSLSAAVDILITGVLCYFLQKMCKRATCNSMAHVVNTMTLYTIENGALTCFTTTATLICWLTMRNNLVFLGVHFVISKLYANSLLFSLNTRQELCEMRKGSPERRWSNASWSPPGPVLTFNDHAGSGARRHSYCVTTSCTLPTPVDTYRPAFKVNPRALPPLLEIDVQRTVERRSDELSEIIRANDRPGSNRMVDPWRSLP